MVFWKDLGTGQTKHDPVTPWGFCHANYTEDLCYQKSTSGYVFMLTVENIPESTIECTMKIQDSHVQLVLGDPHGKDVLNHLAAQQQQRLTACAKFRIGDPEHSEDRGQASNWDVMSAFTILTLPDHHVTIITCLHLISS